MAPPRLAGPQTVFLVPGEDGKRLPALGVGTQRRRGCPLIQSPRQPVSDPRRRNARPPPAGRDRNRGLVCTEAHQAEPTFSTAVPRKPFRFRLRPLFKQAEKK